MQRYNIFPSVPVQGDTPRRGSRPARRSTPWSASRESLPPGVGFEWTELAYQERATGNTATYIFALAVLFVFLVLAAQYESWALPLAIMLIVPMSVLAALDRRHACAGRTTTS